MILAWARLCEACGIPTRNLNPMEVFTLSERLIRDDVLFSKVLEAHDKNDSIIRRGEREKAIARMTAAERADLRDRVLGIRQMGKNEGR